MSCCDSSVLWGSRATYVCAHSPAARTPARTCRRVHEHTPVAHTTIRVKSGLASSPTLGAHYSVPYTCAFMCASFLDRLELLVRNTCMWELVRSIVRNPSPTPLLSLHAAQPAHAHVYAHSHVCVHRRHVRRHVSRAYACAKRTCVYAAGACVRAACAHTCASARCTCACGHSAQHECRLVGPPEGILCARCSLSCT